MRRSLLLTVMGLGMVVSVLGATGVMAVFSDTADTGPNRFATGERGATADIQVADGSFDVAGATPEDSCAGQYHEYFDSALFLDDDAQPDNAPQDSHDLCIKNVGAASVALTASSIDVADIETGCSVDEEAVDTSCGSGQEGELSPLVSEIFVKVDCASGADIDSRGHDIAFMASTPLDLGVTLEPGAVACFRVVLVYDPSTADANVAQTDQVAWKLRFTATAA